MNLFLVASLFIAILSFILGSVTKYAFKIFSMLVCILITIGFIKAFIWNKDDDERNINV